MNEYVDLPAGTTTFQDRFKELTGFERVTIHELGHAVVSAFLGQPPFQVNINRMGYPPGVCVPHFTEEDMGQNLLTENHAISTAASCPAVEKALKGYDLPQTQHDSSVDSPQDEYAIDRSNLNCLAQYLKISDADLKVWTDQQYAKARAILEQEYVWKALLRLAPELEQRETLQGTRVCEILAQERIAEE